MAEVTPYDKPLSFAIITCSDDRTLETDTAGANLKALISMNGWFCKMHVLVPCNRALIANAIVTCDAPDVDVILTIGGTGLSPLDVTPDATMDVCTREIPGIAEQMRAHGSQINPKTMLSRSVCMQRITPENGPTIVFNLPASKKAAGDNWEPLVQILPSAVEMQTAPYRKAAVK